MYWIESIQFPEYYSELKKSAFENNPNIQILNKCIPFCMTYGIAESILKYEMQKNVVKVKQKMSMPFYLDSSKSGVEQNIDKNISIDNTLCDAKKNVEQAVCESQSISSNIFRHHATSMAAKWYIKENFKRYKQVYILNQKLFLRLKETKNIEIIPSEVLNNLPFD